MRKVIQVVGELLMTAGLVLLLFVGWDLWWTNVTADHQQEQAVQSFTRQFTPPAAPPAGAGARDYGTPRVAQAQPHGEMLGVVYVPRFGADYSRPLIQGTSQDVLDTLGLGHYDKTAMPGAGGELRPGRAPADPRLGAGQHPPAAAR
ncbi:sortase (surface protein transpeptidase) [Arthrobacter woluwensis]|nr:sortase (surface protein transpeptidase) [Arthrobacter woluwensis]